MPTHIDFSYMKDNRVSAAYWTQSDSIGTQVSASVREHRNGSYIDHAETLFLPANASPTQIVNAVLEYAVLKSGVKDSLIEYSGHPQATVSSIYGRQDLTLKEIKNADNNAWPGVQRSVRTTLLS